MATLEQLEIAGVLIRHHPSLERWEMPERCMRYSIDFGNWSDGILKPAVRVRGRNLSPYEQVEQIFHDFVIGRPMTYGVHHRKLEPLGQHIWELKTPDVRVFGWFARRGHFVAMDGEFKDNLSSSKQKKSTAQLYNPHIQRVLDFRNALALDEPKLITGLNHNDIL